MQQDEVRSDSRQDDYNENHLFQQQDEIKKKIVWIYWKNQLNYSFEMVVMPLIQDD